MQDFRNLKVWSKSHQFTLDIYQVTRLSPADERFGLTNQIRRACASIGANLAEGCGRKSDADMAGSCKWQWVRPAKLNIV